MGRKTNPVIIVPTQALSSSARAVASAQALLSGWTGWTITSDVTAEQATAITGQIRSQLREIGVEDLKRLRLQAAPLLRDLKRASDMLIEQRTVLQEKIVKAGSHRVAAAAYAKRPKGN